MKRFSQGLALAINKLKHYIEEEKKTDPFLVKGLSVSLNCVQPTLERGIFYKVS